MTIRHLKIFLTLCSNHLNMTKTAKVLHMTQPAISVAIKELERYYGTVLFDRIGHRLKITQAGLQLKEYASHILSLYDDMEKSMYHWDASGLLRIGASITIGSQFLPYYIKTFTKQNPSTKVKVLVSSSDQLENKIADNELDFALIEGYVHHSEFIAKPYMEDELIVIAPGDSPYKPGQEISIQEFRQQKFLLREHGSGTRETFDNVIHAAGFSIEPIWEAMSTTALVNAVINGLGISVLPYRMIINPIQRGLIIPVQVQGLEFKRKFQIIYHKDKFMTSSALSFIQLCRDYETNYPLPVYNGLY